MGCAAVEVGKREKPRLRLRVIASRCRLTAHAEFVRVGHVDVDRISRELGIGTDELEATLPADGAAAAVATHEKSRAKALLARMDGHFIVRTPETVDTVAALDLDADGDRASGEHALEMLHRAPELDGGRAWQSIRPPRRVDVAVFELDAREVTGRPALRCPGCRLTRLAGRTSGTRFGRNPLQKPAPVESFDAWAPESSHSKQEPLQG